MKIFVVIPAYNESKRIKAVIQDVKNNSRLPIIVVDDGSKDSTFEIARSLKIVALRHKVNLGKGAAMKTGAEAAFRLGAEAIIFMDSDGQHKAKDLKKFARKLEEKNDLIFGIRKLGKNTPLIRLLGNKFASLLVKILFGIYLPDILCGFRSLTKKAYKLINLESLGYAIEIEMVIKTLKTGLKYCEVPVQTIYYDKVKGVTILDSFGIILEIIRWRLKV